MENESRHQCLIYSGPPSKQLPALATAIQLKLEAGYRCMYMNSVAMVAGVRSALAALGVDPQSEIRSGRLILTSDSVTLPDGTFDSTIMLQQLEETLDRALADGFKGLFATGDMTFEFGAEKNFAKLVDYEYQLERLFQKRKGLVGICQYHRDTLPAEVTRQGFLSHRSIFINDTLSRMNIHFVQFGPSSDHIMKNPKWDEIISKTCRV